MKSRRYEAAWLTQAKPMTDPDGILKPRRLQTGRQFKILVHPLHPIMFTGLVETLGTVAAVVPEPPGVRLIVEAPEIAADAALGDSICVSGCCLSVVQLDGGRLEFQLGPETLARTTLGGLAAGGRVNLERSLRLSDRLGGHLVTGHVDGLGRLAARRDDGDWTTCHFEAPPALLAQMASKGSVTIDGVSLTVVEVAASTFSVALIPHTLAATTLGSLTDGDGVNLETDLVFKYVARWLSARDSGAA
jgi:riboflavin synthase